MKRERGVAVVTALLLTTLAVTIVTSLFWQQQVQVRSMENQRLHLQTQWILRGALDFARLVLRQDAADHNAQTTLDSPWATPVAETRLEDYIERDRVQGESFDATLAGNISDAQSRYNLANLAYKRAPNEDQIAIFGRLLRNLGMDPLLARRTALIMQRAQQGEKTLEAGHEDETLELTTVDDLLAVPGFTPDMVARLREFVIMLPGPTPLNVNTALPEVLAATMNVSVSEATAWTESRKRAWWRTVQDFTAQTHKPAPSPVTTGVSSLDVRSDFFLVTTRIRLERATLNAISLIQRKIDFTRATSSPVTVVWTRQI